MSPIVSERAQAIQAAVGTKESESEFGQAPLVIGGDKQMRPVHKIPTRLLAYNIRNGRFKAELLAKERELNRQLAPLVVQDAAMIRDLLLNQDSAQTQLLKDDLEKFGQNEPGIITCDGFVINGNRRMAILHVLHQEQPTGKFEYLQVQILPEKVDPKDLWRIEAGLQLSRDKRLDYGPINDLLKIREGLEAGLTADEIAAALFGVESADEIKAKDDLLKLIDSYLAYAGQKDNYMVLQRSTGGTLVEHFINLQNHMRRLKKASVPAPERNQELLIAFELLRTDRFSHMDIRKLTEIHKADDARQHLVAAVTPSPSTVLTDTKKDEIQEAFQTALDYVDIEKEANKPELLVKRAERAVKALVKHKKAVSKKKGLHKKISSLRNQLAEVEKACSARQGKT